MGVALLLYLPTLMPDVGTWDTAEFQAIGPVLGIAHPTGYPTYTLLAWLASVVLQPFGNEAFRANLLSALLVAGAAALLAVRVVQATRRWPLGVAGRRRLRGDAHRLAHSRRERTLTPCTSSWRRSSWSSWRAGSSATSAVTRGPVAGWWRLPSSSAWRWATTP